MEFSKEFLQEKTWAERLRLVFWGAILIGVILLFVTLLSGPRLLIREPTSYQAVFLDNNQAYFGKLRSGKGDFLTLRDVYYLRVGTLQSAGQNGSVELDLIKLGSEPHGPRDEMIINKAHVLFYQDLSESGQVMKLIRKRQQGK